MSRLTLQATGELWPAVRIAAETVLSPTGLALLAVGASLGLVMGALPGLGGPVALTLLIPVTYGLNLNPAVLVLAATLGGVAFGGSVTAILLNTPGDAPNAATVLDGYPMARTGRAVEAVTASAIASGAGAIIGVVLLVVTIPVVREFTLLFFSVDIFWLAVVGLLTVAVVSRGGLLANLIAGGLGLVLAFHGFNPVTGTARFTWGVTALRDGVGLVPLLIGLFAVAEMLGLAGDGGPVARGDDPGGDVNADEPRKETTEEQSGRRAGLSAVLGNRRVFGQSAAIGWLVGVIPGAGGTVANFVSYLGAQATTGASSFGDGDVRGVIASEAANDAKDGGSMVPTLGLGIPGSASTAVLLGALVVNGVVPGPQLFEENLQLVFVVAFGLLGSNIFTSAVGLVLARQVAALTRVSARTLVPVVLVVALTGAYVGRGSFVDVWLAVLLGVVGFGMLRVGISRVPVVIAFVLGSLAEQNFHRTLQIADGNAAGAFFQRPTSIVLASIALAVVLVPVLRRYRRQPVRNE